MELARRIHKCLTGDCDCHDALRLFNKIKDKDTLAMINEYFMEQYNKTPHEYITEKFDIDEVYAISSTLKFIREPSRKNIEKMRKFYDKIGYIVAA